MARYGRIFDHSPSRFSIDFCWLCGFHTTQSDQSPRNKKVSLKGPSGTSDYPGSFFQHVASTHTHSTYDICLQFSAWDTLHRHIVDLIHRCLILAVSVVQPHYSLALDSAAISVDRLPSSSNPRTTAGLSRTTFDINKSTQLVNKASVFQTIYISIHKNHPNLSFSKKKYPNKNLSPKKIC